MLIFLSVCGKRTRLQIKGAHIALVRTYPSKLEFDFLPGILIAVEKKEPFCQGLYIEEGTKIIAKLER